jgi:hypothetical protein
VRDHPAVQNISPKRRRLILGATFAVIVLGAFGGGLIAGLAGERWAWSPAAGGLVWGVISATTIVAWWLWIKRRL